MKWPITKVEKDLTEWHTWFAWFPVTIGNNMHWMELVSRRALNTTGDDPEGWIVWEYAEVVWYP